MKLTRLLAAAVLAASAFAAVAQPSGAVQSISPITRDLLNVQTLTAQVPGTVNSADQNGYNVSRVVCALKQTANTGGTAATLSIQNKDATSGLYYTLVTSGSMSVNGSISPVSAGSGITSVANVSSNTHTIARTWRTQVVLTGGTNWTGSVGCSVQ